MNFSICKSSLQSRHYDKKLLNRIKQFIFRSSNNAKATLSTRAFFDRQAEFSVSKKQVKSYTSNRFNHDQNFKEVNSSGYLLLSIPVVCFGLGVWQVQRLKWKLGLIHKYKEILTRQPIPLPENLSDLAQLEYQPIKVTGNFLYEKEIVIGPRSLIIHGQSATEVKQNLVPYKDVTSGYNLITPFEVKDRDLIILVNRGWLPKKYRWAEEREEFQDEQTVEIIGVNRLSEKRQPFVMKNDPEKGIWNYKDVEAMAKICNTQPIFLDMVEQRDIPTIPIASQTRINLRNDHWSYILTWFGLSVSTIYIWYRIYKRKKPNY